MSKLRRCYYIRTQNKEWKKKRWGVRLGAEELFKMALKMYIKVPFDLAWIDTTASLRTAIIPVAWFRLCCIRVFNFPTVYHFFLFNFGPRPVAIQSPSVNFRFIGMKLEAQTRWQAQAETEWEPKPEPESESESDSSATIFSHTEACNC